MCDFNGVLRSVIGKYRDDDKWNKAEFEQMKRLSNSKVGDVGQDFIEEICNYFQFNCEFPENKTGKRARQSPWDIKINN